MTSSSTPIRYDSIESPIGTLTFAVGPAGLSEARYRQVRKSVNKVLQTLDFQGTIDGPLSIDLERASVGDRPIFTSDVIG